MTVNPNGAPPGYYYDAATKRYVKDPAGTFSTGGATAPMADPGGTFSAAGASAPTTDLAGTYSSASALNRFYVEWQNIVPSGTALAFHNAIDVENYFGLGSVEGNEALTFFGPHNVYGLAGATMYFGRDPIGQRPHDLSANIANMTVADLQAIQGSLNVTWNGWTYSGNIDLSNVSGTQGEAAQLAVKDIQTALNMHRSTQAVVTATITPETVTFQGSFDKAQFTVTKILSDTSPTGAGIIDGGIISGQGIAAGTDTQVIHDHNPPGSKGGPGSYSTFHSIKGTASGTFTETYGLMTIKSVVSGTVEDGVQIQGAGVTGLAPATGLVENVSGSGAGSQWIVNNAPTIATPETMTLKAPLIGVYLNRDGNVIQGATENNEIIDVSVQGEFGYDTNHSPAMSYVSGTAAPLLNLTQDTGALPPSDGGDAFSVAHMMTLFQNEMDQYGTPVEFGSVFSNDPRLDANILAWTDTRQGMAEQYMTNNGPAGQSTAVTDPFGTHSGPGASTPIWGAAPSTWGTIGHGPG